MRRSLASAGLVSLLLWPCCRLAVAGPPSAPIRTESSFAITYRQDGRATRRYEGSSVEVLMPDLRLFLEVKSGSGTLMALVGPQLDARYWENGRELPVRYHLERGFHSALAAMAPGHLKTYEAYLETRFAAGAMSRSASDGEKTFSIMSLTEEDGSYYRVDHVFSRSEEGVEYTRITTDFPSESTSISVARVESGETSGCPEVPSVVETKDDVNGTTTVPGGFDVRLTVDSCEELPESFDLDAHVEARTAGLMQALPGPPLYDLSLTSEAPRNFVRGVNGISLWQAALGAVGLLGLGAALFLRRR